MYRQASDRLKSEKTRLQKSALKESREQFFDTIDTKEVNE